MAKETRTGDARGGRRHPARKRNVGTVRRFFEVMHEKDIEGWGKLWQ